jgi:hypothetical protein
MTVPTSVVLTVVEIGYDGAGETIPAASTFPRVENSIPNTAAELAQYFKKSLLRMDIDNPSRV